MNRPGNPHSLQNHTRKPVAPIGGLLILVAALSGCAVKTVSPFEALEVPGERILRGDLTQQDVGKGRVIITRDRQSFEVFSVARTCKLRLLIDHEEAAIIKSKERIELYLAPGKHVLGMDTDLPNNICARLGEFENVTYFDVVPDSTTLLRITYGGIPEIEAEKQVRKQVREGVISRSEGKARIAAIWPAGIPAIAVVCSVSASSSDTDFQPCPSRLTGEPNGPGEVTCGCQL